MSEGWIKLFRGIRKHWIWEDAQKLKWWLDILLQANHQDRKILLGSELIFVERGSFHTSELKLATRWGVSKTTVRKYLELLESDYMITTVKCKKGTTVKVSNYEDYQGFSEEEKTDKKPQKNHDVDHEKTIEEPSAIPIKNHEVYTNNNDKECNKNDEELKKEKNEKNGKNNFSSDSNEYRLAVYLFNFIKRNNEKAKEPNYQSWAKQFDYILRLDNRELAEVKELIKFSQQHNFWFKNILSPDSLRKQYDRLLIEMKNPGKNSSSNFNNFEQRQDKDPDYIENLEKKALAKNEKGAAPVTDIQNMIKGIRTK